ncbi:O-antigen ligase [Alteromonas gracilis]|uniref:O-antigen ligase family protein n=1 Tax=Alteromonas gracilis TaxID=1479524 RepID=UPI0036F27D70
MKLSHQSIICLLFCLILFFSTGALIDFWVLGTSDVFAVEPLNPQLRGQIWALLYLGMVIYTARHFRRVYEFLSKNQAFFLVIFFILISFTWSDIPSKSIYSAVQLIIITCFVIVAASKLSINQVLQCLYFTLSVIIVLSAFTVLALPEYGTRIYVGELSYRGVFIEKNRLGQVLVYYLCFSIFLFKPKTTNYIVAGCAAFLITNNNSMTALLLCFFTIILIGIVRLLKTNPIIRNKNLSIISLILTVSLLILFLAFEAIMLALGKDPTLTGRTELWKYGIDAILERPFTGFGYDAYWSSTYEWGGEYMRQVISWGPMSMHNGWYELILQIGIPGFSLFLYLFIKTMTSVIQNLNKEQNEILSLIFMLLVLFMIWSLFQHIILRHQAFNHILFTVILVLLQRCLSTPTKQLSGKT